MGEEKSSKIYEDTLDNKLAHLNIKQQLIVKDQKCLLKDDHNRIKLLSESFAFGKSFY